MKQKFQNKILRVTKFSFLLSFLLAGFFGTNNIVFADYSLHLSVQNANYSLGRGSIFVHMYVTSNSIVSVNHDTTVRTSVNNQAVGQINTNWAALESHNDPTGDTYQTVSIDPQLGFVAGSNTISVTINDSNSTNISQSINVNVSPAGTPGKGGTGSCHQDPDCATTGNSQFGYICSNSGTCLEDINLPVGEHCNTNQASGDDCVTGATCSGGTCVSNSTSGGPAMQSNPVGSLINPIGRFDNITSLLINIMKGFLAIVGVWAVAFIVIGGFQMVIAAGNEETYLKARKTITWAVLGLLVAVLSFSLIAIVQNLIGVNVPPPTATQTTTK